MITGFGCYEIYLALKQHFGGKGYDYIRYNGRIRCLESTYNKRNDKYFFEKLANKFKSKEAVEAYLVPVIYNKPKMWIGELLSDASQKIYDNHKNRRNRLVYLFKEELTHLVETIDFVDALRSKNGQHPEILHIVNRKEFGEDCLLVLNQLIHLFDKWDTQIQDPIIWPDYRTKLLKLQPFLNLEPLYEEFKKSFLEIMRGNTWNKNQLLQKPD